MTNKYDALAYFQKNYLKENEYLKELSEKKEIEQKEIDSLIEKVRLNIFFYKNFNRTDSFLWENEEITDISNRKKRASINILKYLLNYFCEYEDNKEEERQEDKVTNRYPELEMYEHNFIQLNHLMFNIKDEKHRLTIDEARDIIKLLDNSLNKVEKIMNNYMVFTNNSIDSFEYTKLIIEQNLANKIYIYSCVKGLTKEEVLNIKNKEVEDSFIKIKENEVLNNKKSDYSKEDLVYRTLRFLQDKEKKQFKGKYKGFNKENFNDNLLAFYSQFAYGRCGVTINRLDKEKNESYYSIIFNKFDLLINDDISKVNIIFDTIDKNRKEFFKAVFEVLLKSYILDIKEIKNNDDDFENIIEVRLNVGNIKSVITNILNAYIDGNVSKYKDVDIKEDVLRVLLEESEKPEAATNRKLKI